LLYKDYGQLPAIQPFLYGIKPAIIAIILGAIFLWQRNLKTVQLGIIGGIVFSFRCCSSMKLYFFWRRILSFILEFIDQQEFDYKGNSWIPLMLFRFLKRLY
jgi:chromate transporter